VRVGGLVESPRNIEPSPLLRRAWFGLRSVSHTGNGSEEPTAPFESRHVRRGTLLWGNNRRWLLYLQSRPSQLSNELPPPESCFRLLLRHTPKSFFLSMYCSSILGKIRPLETCRREEPGIISLRSGETELAQKIGAGWYIVRVGCAPFWCTISLCCLPLTWPPHTPKQMPHVAKNPQARGRLEDAGAATRALCRYPDCSRWLRRPRPQWRFRRREARNDYSHTWSHVQHGRGLGISKLRIDRWG